MDIIALLIAIALFLLGLVGTVVPVVPGVLLIWLGMFLYGLLTGFESLSVGFFFFQGLAALLVIMIDYLATALGSKKFGSTKLSAGMAVAGLIFGMLLIGPPGLIFGPFIGALVGELLQKKPVGEALYSSVGSVAGLFGGVILKFGIEMIMIVWFVIRI